MKLQDLLASLLPKNIVGDVNIELNGIEIDSRQIKNCDLFVALRGTQIDGHVYIDSAINNGAVAILCEVLPENLHPEVTYVVVDNAEAVVGCVATRFYGNPTGKLRLVGVTGTNGKTTIATLLYKLFRKIGYKVGLVSTVCNYIDDEAIPTSHTTPDAITLNRLLARMVEAGCEYAFMEVSSHSVAQQRIGGLRFSGGIFTNLTRDHLDYHLTVENYLKAKKTFFDMLPTDAFAVTNIDDKNGMVMVQNTKAKVKTYSLQRMADFKGRVLEDHFDGMLMDVNGKEALLSFTGHFNALNLLAVYGAAVMLGEDKDEVLTKMTLLKPVAGRFETITLPNGSTGIVDYAHTPDALENVLSCIENVLGGRGRIITVVGAGGNRDKGKRPLMAKEAVKRSHKVVITSDNPRFEEPGDIINDMLAGLTNDERRNVLAITDRKEAIRTAFMLSEKGDVVLVAGKGHENYQEIKGVKHHFDDMEVLKELLKN